MTANADLLYRHCYHEASNLENAAAKLGAIVHPQAVKLVMKMKGRESGEKRNEASDYRSRQMASLAASGGGGDIDMRGGSDQ